MTKDLYNKDLYNKDDKAGSEQQLRYRMTMLEDSLRKLEAEKLSILADMVEINIELNKELGCYEGQGGG